MEFSKSGIESLINYDSDLSLAVVLFNLCVGFVMGYIISLHYRKFGSALSNKDDLAKVLPAILLTTLLIITIVKSSLALSLGLVGALSIVRFRTPIKEPEELAYLFISIATGLGLGANQLVITVTSVLMILTFLVFYKKKHENYHRQNIHLSVKVDVKETDFVSASAFSTEISKIITSSAKEASLRRFDVNGNICDLHYTLALDGADSLWRLVDKLKEVAPQSNVLALDNKEISVI